MRVRTAGGSTYLIGPSPHRYGVRVARVSDHAVGGTIGPATFAEEFASVELVSEGGALRLRCTHASGTQFATSPIVHVTHETVAAATA